MNPFHRILIVAAGLVAAAAVHANEIAFVEDFSLAEDRTEALKQLIPGTQEYYFYHCLYYQHTGDDDALHKTLAQWIKRHDYTEGVKEIRNRQALITYDTDPDAALKHIIDELDIHFNHARVVADQKPNYSTRLDATQISIPTLLERAFRSHSNLHGITDAGLDILPHGKLDPDRRRDLLQRLQRPDIPGLAELVVADLQHKHSGGFGSHSIHPQLLFDQLEACAARMPRLMENSAFVYAMIAKLAPSDDVDMRFSPQEEDAYVNRLLEFTRKLAPAFTSLKVHALYHRMRLDRAAGTFNRDLFLEYIKLPRSASYVNPEWLRRASQQKVVHANLGEAFEGITRLPPVGDDQPLVEEILSHFFVEADDYTAYEKYIRDTFLKQVFAETKIVNGIGDMERWYSLMSPSDYQALKERIDLDFGSTNPEFFEVDDEVGLDLFVKNIDTLLVKVFRINAVNYYRITASEITTAIDLDGLVAEDEMVLEYKEPEVRRVKRTFTFPQCDRPGVYVIEWVGNGVSSRAVVRKGRLHMTTRIGPAGHEFAAYDEANQRRPDASLWLHGKEYEAEDDGLIFVPFSTHPQSQAVVLQDGDRSSLARFNHQPESYSLNASIYVDRESLRRRGEAQVLVRPTLLLNGEPVTLSLLEEVRLAISSVDRDGVASSSEVADFALHEDRETVHTFKVPENLSQIIFTLHARVENTSLSKKEDLAQSQSFSLNAIDSTLRVEDVHLAHVEDGYSIHVLGKNGEAKPDRPVQVQLQHRYFTNPVHVTLQSDESGIIQLGVLAGIDWIKTQGPDGTERQWSTTRDRYPYPPVLHTSTTEPLQFPYVGADAGEPRLEYALLERRGNTYLANHTSAIRVENGFLVAEGLAPGDYELFIKDVAAAARIRITQGEDKDGYIFSEKRVLQRRNAMPLQIAGVEAGKKSLRITTVNANTFTRVHVVATQYLPAYDLFSLLDVPKPGSTARRFGRPQTQYISGRNIGDEYRYILERRYAEIFPGNMLERPGLLLNPWSIRKTSTETDEAEAGEAFDSLAAMPEEKLAEAMMDRLGIAGPNDAANLDFIGAPPAVLANLKPDADGNVTIDREKLGPYSQIHIVAADPRSTVYREFTLPESAEPPEDLRLMAGLDPAEPVTEQKTFAVRAKGEPFTLEDITTSEMELYDSLDRVFNLFTTLSENATLDEFRFVLGWPDLEKKEKQDLYAKHACHELSFFLYHKDRPFFDSVIRPYLAHKKDKTFLDHWLLDADLSPYLDAWAYAQLNAVERILLAQRAPEGSAGIPREIRERFDLIPPNVDQWNQFMDTALRGGALETGDRLGLSSAIEDAKHKKSELRRRMASKEGAEIAEMEVMASFDEAPSGAGFADMAAAITAGSAGNMALWPSDPVVRGDQPAKKEYIEVGRQIANEEVAFGGGMAGKDAYFAMREDQRDQLRRLWRQLDKTEEWVENNYYKLPIEQQNAALISVNAFWNDYADHDPAQSFISPHFVYAVNTFAEMMLALSVLDLPFTAPEHVTAVENATFTLTPGDAALIAHKVIRPGEPGEKAFPLLVSQNFFRADDRYTFERNERFDKFVTEEFLPGVAYGGQIVLTNPTSTRRKLRLLLQIPEGALPLQNGFYTRSIPVTLEPYATRTQDFFFYFPETGHFRHYPVHVAQEERHVTAAEAFVFHVVPALSKIDTASWDYISQNGNEKEVLDYLDTHNVFRLNLEKIAWRMKDRKFFRQALDLLTDRRAYHHTLWSYGLRHNDLQPAREYLQHSPFAGRCGAWIDTPLLTIDPVERSSYQHMEYAPLVNARAHMLGKERKILNDRFHGQYHRFMNVLQYRPALDSTDRLGVAYYLFLQDRVAEGLDFFDRVERGEIHEGIQYDYLRVYADFYRGNTSEARHIAEQYAAHPVPRWQKRFADAVAQLDKIGGGAAAIVDVENREQVQGRLAATEPSFEFKVEENRMKIDYQNIKEIVVKIYPMDIELLFSRNPFVQEDSGQFAYINPRSTETHALPEGETTAEIAVPEAFRNSNVMIEISAGGLRKSQAYYANSLSLQVIENYGIVQVTHRETREPFPKTYVKAYARMLDGQVRFYKDGYTDLRGKFDYVSLSTSDLDGVKRFALLVLHDEHGAVIREAAPPTR